mgnify:CR=1 FL=1
MQSIATETALPSSLEALVLLGPDEYEVQSVPVPEPGRHEVVCEVHSVAICGTELDLISVNFLMMGCPRGFP